MRRGCIMMKCVGLSVEWFIVFFFDLYEKTESIVMLMCVLVCFNIFLLFLNGDLTFVVI